MPKLPRPLEGQVKIIGGFFRGRTVTFPSIGGLRPTPNRIRETLFNWLAPYIKGANCLDLFAGSGALSFEAISRGAKYALLLDSSPQVIQALQANSRRLKMSNLDIQVGTFPYPLDLTPLYFDIVFLDPPFHEGYVPAAIEWLQKSSYVHQESLIYIESESDQDVIQIPACWQILKDKMAGSVRYTLMQVDAMRG